MNDTSQEDRLVAAMSHASVLLPLIGIAIPIGIWLSQGKRSPLLKFQALQALSYQLVAIFTYFLLMGCRMLMSFAIFPTMMVPMAMIDNPQALEVSEPTGVIFMILSGVLCVVGVLFNVLMCIVGPTYMFIALIGGWRVLNGDNFHYPILGHWIEKRLGQDSTSIQI